jgi:hypothetical protein
MPNVPFIANQRNLTNLPGVSVQAPGPDAFGAGLGEGIQDLGNSLGQAFTQIRERKERVNVMASKADLASKQTAFMHGTVDPQTGAVVPGALSKQGLDASGVALSFSKQNQEWLKEYKSKLSAEEWAQFEPWAMDRLNDGVSRMADHEIIEGRKGQVESFLASSETMYNVAVRNYDKDKEYDKGVDDSAMALASAMNVQGKTGQEIADKVNKLRNKSAVDRVQSAIANKRYDLAMKYAASDKLLPEQQGELAKRIESEREQEKRLAKAQLDHDAAELHNIEAAKFSKASRYVNWGDPAEAEKYFSAVDASPSPTAAEEYTNKGRQLQASYWSGVKEVQTEEQKKARNRLESELSVGLKVGPRGEVIKAVPDERHAAIDAAVRNGDLLFSQGKGLHDMVDSDHAKAMQDLAAEVLTTVVPEAKKYLAYKENGTTLAFDDAGRPVIGKPGNKKPPYDPKKELFSRKYETGGKKLGILPVDESFISGMPDDWKKSVTPVYEEENVTLENVSDALRLVNDMMRSDKTMTHAKAVEKFREIIRPAKDAAAKASIANTLALERIVQRNFESRWMQSYVDRTAPVDRTPMTADRLKSSTLQRAFGPTGSALQSLK